jgi:16S rRNA (guanine966-N2)-methyltransferase
MRITGGELRGRQIRVPKSGVRPTQDRVRAALFSILAERIAGARVLDLCAGSGSLGLEAWSREASFVCWVEADRRTFSILEGNVRELCGARTGLFCMDAIRFIKKRLVTEGFHIIFCDPPYEKMGRDGMLGDLLEALGAGDILMPGGLFVMEQDAGEGLCRHTGWRLVDDRVYGQTRLRFFVRQAPGQEEGERA